MKFISFLKALPLVIIAGAVVYLMVSLCLDNSDWAYILARLMGFEEKYANNISLMAIAAQSLFFTSDWFYGHIRSFLNRRIDKAKGLNRQIYLGYKIGIECLMALPKRTLLFAFYLLLIIGESMGLIDQAKDYATMIVFIIAVDRVTKIWPEEKGRFKNFSRKIGQRIKSVGLDS